jgi:hypothetical protein
MIPLIDHHSSDVTKWGRYCNCNLSRTDSCKGENLQENMSP